MVLQTQKEYQIREDIRSTKGKLRTKDDNATHIDRQLLNKSTIYKNSNLFCCVCHSNNLTVLLMYFRKFVRWTDKHSVTVYFG